ncbi:hypothetical protein C8F04DRAFT_1178770 [Mycena alexandri]|uniref:Uncharacterized protein n=1 Tax=Mycena alexandri TaxID=1745969 RepID=A0AAD6X8U2_9AGAR|nr:hypothetical protein C8F04DRAFT_1178770 [Mycena alexandri]
MLSIFLISSLLSLSGVNAWCGDNGGAVIGWGTQAETDQRGPNAFLGFNSSGPFDAAGNPILTVVSNAQQHEFAAFICGQANPDSYPQTTFGPVISLTGDPSLCFTVSELEAANATVSLLPCVTAIQSDPYLTQMFQWIGTAYITYGFVFLGNQTGLPLDPSVATDYTPSLVPATNTTAAYLRLDYTPGGLPPSTGLETGLVLILSDDD